MILNKNEILRLIDEKQIVVTPYEESNVFETGIKLRIDPKVKKMLENADLQDLNKTKFEEFSISEEGYTLAPSEYLTGYTLENIQLPNNIWGLLDTRGSFAKVGLKLLFDYHVDPQSKGKLTIHIKNLANVPIKIYPNLYAMRITLFQTLR